MSWIKVIDEKDATGELKKTYKTIKAKRGKIANIMKIHSLNPEIMKNHMDFYLTIMFGHSGLKRAERELIGVVVSATNNCKYCTNHHAEALNYFWKDRDKIQKLIQDYKSVPLPERTQKMLDYAVKLTQNPQTISQSDITALQKCGFSDENILNINLITSYFNFVNRIALGLGVKFTNEEMKDYKYKYQ